jgi:Lrp/AsnC family transcriptional regulator, leucine-responsive regulatory protein
MFFASKNIKPQLTGPVWREAQIFRNSYPRQKMDRTDKKILELLQTNSQISNQELAEKVALSPSPCARRVKQLEDEGYINKYVALLNPEKVGLPLAIIVLVELNNHNAKKMRDFETAIASFPEVIQCYLIAGQSADYMLKVVVPSLNDYQLFLLNKLTQLEMVSSVHSSFVLCSIADKTALPLSQLSSVSTQSRKNT